MPAHHITSHFLPLYNTPTLSLLVEAIVRRRSAAGEEAPAEATSPCPISAQEIPVYSLESPATKDSIPMCAITGSKK